MKTADLAQDLGFETEETRDMYGTQVHAFAQRESDLIALRDLLRAEPGVKTEILYLGYDFDRHCPSLRIA